MVKNKNVHKIIILVFYEKCLHNSFGKVCFNYYILTQRLIISKLKYFLGVYLIIQ